MGPSTSHVPNSAPFLAGKRELSLSRARRSPSTDPTPDDGLRVAALSGCHSALMDLLERLRNLSHVVSTILDEVGQAVRDLCGIHLRH